MQQANGQDLARAASSAPGNGELRIIDHVDMVVPVQERFDERCCSAPPANNDGTELAAILPLLLAQRAKRDGVAMDGSIPPVRQRQPFAAYLDGATPHGFIGLEQRKIPMERGNEHGANLAQPPVGAHRSAKQFFLRHHTVLDGAAVHGVVTDIQIGVARHGARRACVLHRCHRAARHRAGTPAQG